MYPNKSASKLDITALFPSNLPLNLFDSFPIDAQLEFSKLISLDKFIVFPVKSFPSFTNFKSPANSLAVFKVNIFYLATNVFQVNYRFVNLENVNIL